MIQATHRTQGLEVRTLHRFIPEHNLWLPTGRIFGTQSSGPGFGRSRGTPRLLSDCSSHGSRIACRQTNTGLGVRA